MVSSQPHSGPAHASPGLQLFGDTLLKGTDKATALFPGLQTERPPGAWQMVSGVDR